MSKGLLILIIVIVLVLLAAVVNRHRHRIEWNRDVLSKQVDKIFAEEGVDSIEKHDFLRDLKRTFTCTSKESSVLMGRAREWKIIDVDSGQVTKHHE